MSRIKILSVTHYAALYGANRSLLNLIQGTSSQIEWIVICKESPNSSGDLKQELMNLGVKFYSVPFRIDVYSGSPKFLKRWVFFPLEFLFNIILAAFTSLYALFNKVNIIHTNSSATCFGAYIGYITGISHVWHFREFLDLDYNYGYKFGMNYLKFWADKASMIISVSTAVDEKAVKSRNINSKSKILYNGVVLNKDIPAMKSRTVGDPVKLIIVGLIGEAKNQLQAIQACKILESRGVRSTLKIIGEPSGTYYHMLKEYVQENKLGDCVVFAGYNPDQSSIFEDADITVMASLNEGMGRVTIESMVHSIPVVGFDNAGTSELITHKQTGILYKGNAESLADAISSLLDDRSLYLHIRSQGYKLIRNCFTIERYAEQFVGIIKTLK